MNNFLSEVMQEDLKFDKIYLNQLFNQKSNEELIDYIILKLGGREKFEHLLKNKYQTEYVCNDCHDSIVFNEIDLNIDYQILKEFQILPIRKIENLLYIAIDDIYNYEIINKIKIVITSNIKFVLAKKSYINSNLYKYYQDNVKSNINNISLDALIENTLSYAVNSNASDIHIEPYENEFIIRFRVDGDLITVNNFNISLHKKLISKIKIMSNVDISKKMIPQDGHLKLDIMNEIIDFRLSTMPTIFGEKAVLRIMYNTNNFDSKKSLGFFQEDIEIIENMLNNLKGLILVTGSTGSGKSTTLSTMLKEIDYKSKNVITIEEPVENVIEGITQINLNEKAGLTFNNSLQYILRQDPDIIMLGEIRDSQTSQFAIRSSITGHLVLSTLHTNNAVTSITRLINMGIEPYLITSCLKGVISQRLVKKVCEKCKTSRYTSKEEEKIFDFKEKQLVYFGIGCNECNGTGKKGRIILCEILEINNEIKNIILKEENIENILVNNSFYKNIRKNLIKGNICVEEALKVILEIRYDTYEKVRT